MNNKHILLVTLYTVLSFTACRSNDTMMIEMVGIAEKELASDMTAVSISFNGTAEQKEKFMNEITHGELSRFNPRLLHENMYQEGEANEVKNRRFLYTINYLFILDSNRAINDLAAIMQRKELPGYISSMGKYVNMDIMKEYQNTLFTDALNNAKDRVSRYINDESKSYQILEISELEDLNHNSYPIDGIIYNNKIAKRVRVKARIN